MAIVQTLSVRSILLLSLLIDRTITVCPHLELTGPPQPNAYRRDIELNYIRCACATLHYSAISTTLAFTLFPASCTKCPHCVVILTRKIYSRYENILFWRKGGAKRCRYRPESCGIRVSSLPRFASEL